MNEWALIILMALITFSIRYVLIASAGRWHLPSTMERGLKYIPVAVLSAIVVQTIMMKSDNGQASNWSIDIYFLISAVIAFGVARATKNLMITVTAGLLCYGIIKYLVQA